MIGTTENARKEYNRYQREWRAKNKDRVREINRRYWEKRANKRESENEQKKAD